MLMRLSALPRRFIRHLGPVLGIALLAMTLSGCGSGPATVQTAASDSLPSPGGSSATNHAPTITGTPSGQVLAGQSYGFTPAATDADSDKLTFSAQNLPAWASIDASTGHISGTPTAANIGVSGSIQITVSDGNATASLTTFTITVAAATTAAGWASVTWQAPTLRQDGSALTNLAGYRVYYGTSANSLTNSIAVNDAGANNYQVTSLAAGTYYFAVSAIDSDGTESPLSLTASKTIT